jgi:muramoyltetrapeptide carboxypeptidase LdcA involved in peptidoglycan recycling
MRTIIPPKLKSGDVVRVVAPSRSLKILSKEICELANERLRALGLTVEFGEHARECDALNSSSVEARVADLHAAFSDTKVKAILTVIGGFNSNQLLSHLDYDLIRANPKILCGYSDITALENAIFAKTGLVTYSGLFYSTFGRRKDFEYCPEYFQKCLFSDALFAVEPSKEWSDDEWWLDQQNREFIDNPGWTVVNTGEAQGIIVGGNLCTFNLLQGTPYFPDLTDSILFLEDDEESQHHHFDRDLQSLTHLPQFKGVRGLVLGRFQKVSGMTDEKIYSMIQTKPELRNLPVIANVDFGHTEPLITFPIGGQVKIIADKSSPKITITEH